MFGGRSGRIMGRSGDLEFLRPDVLFEISAPPAFVGTRKPLRRPAARTRDGKVDLPLGLESLKLR